MASSRTVVIAGAGIGGLTAALTVARQGYRVVLLEQTERLEETGAGIQLSPNASRVLIALGLHERLAAHVTAPEELSVANAIAADPPISPMRLKPVVSSKLMLAVPSVNQSSVNRSSRETRPPVTSSKKDRLRGSL